MVSLLLSHRVVVTKSAMVTMVVTRFVTGHAEGA
jgi:hypothetical protein